MSDESEPRDAAEQAVAERRAFAVRFQDLGRWDVGSFTSLDWSWPPDVIWPLSDVIARRRQVVTDVSGRSLLTLRFSGDVEVRDGRGASSIKGTLYEADPGDLVYSKIDVRHGAIGVVPATIGPACVTAEYPVYDVREDVADPEYVALVVRSSVFRSKIQSMITGASGRKRVQPDDLEDVPFPLLTLHEQRAIVSAWRRARSDAEALRERAEAAGRQAEIDFLAALGLERPQVAERPKAFAVPWSKIGSRWGLPMILRAQTPAQNPAFPSFPIAKLCQTGSGGTPSRSRDDYFGGEIPWVKTTEVRGSLIESTEETLTPEGLAASSARIYPPGSIVIAMYGQGATRGRTAKLGISASTNQACLVLHSFRDDILGDYLWRFLTVRYHHLRSLASGNNQPNLSSHLIRSYKVPLPSLALQKQLSEALDTDLASASALRVQARRRLAGARAEVEGMILGTRPIPAS